MLQNLLSAAVVIGALRVNDDVRWLPLFTKWVDHFEKNSADDNTSMNNYPAFKRALFLHHEFDSDKVFKDNFLQFS